LLSIFTCAPTHWWPTFSDMQIAFIGKPDINFNLNLVGGDITTVPFVEKLLNNLIKNVLVGLMAGGSLRRRTRLTNQSSVWACTLKVGHAAISFLTTLLFLS